MEDQQHHEMLPLLGRHRALGYGRLNRRGGRGGGDCTAPLIAAAPAIDSAALF